MYLYIFNRKDVKTEYSQKMENILIVIVTGETCGVCKGKRGNGIIGNKTEYMSFVKLKEILHDGATLLNIHYSRHYQASNDLAMDISKIKYQPKTDTVVQEKCFQYNKKTRSLILEMGSDEQPKIRETISVRKDKSDEMLDWKEFVKSYIPQKIYNYTKAYMPCIMIIRKNDWLTSQKKDTPLLAVTDRSFTIEKDGDFLMDNTPGALYQRVVKLEDMLKELREGKFRFEVKPSEKKVPPPPPLRKEEGKKKEVRFSDKFSYRIIYYDDPPIG
jgi:hypothetical protein